METWKLYVVVLELICLWIAIRTYRNLKKIQRSEQVSQDLKYIRLRYGLKK